MAKVVVVQGLQFGSEAKGQISGMVAQQWQPDVVVCANHPNAGHTYHDPNGNKFIHRILPVGAAVKAEPGTIRHILIGPGAVIDTWALREELHLLSMSRLLDNSQLVIHPNATILLPEHVEAEKSLVAIGSTMKGSMAAVAAKMRRSLSPAAPVAKHFRDLLNTMAGGYLPIRISAEHYNVVTGRASKILVEGAQGFSLGIHERFYPYGTSRDVSTHQVLADCRIPHGFPVYVHGVARTFPIRVANRFDIEGNQIGTSGPCYPGQSEMKWDDIGRDPELTTVTKLPRRLFTFSSEQIIDAVEIMGAEGISLTFCDYLSPGGVKDLAATIEALVINARATSYSFGPRYADVKEWSPFYNREGEMVPMDFHRHIEDYFRSVI